ncbi:MAG: hypothetical protein QF466_01830 [Desulfobacterales bacterium]|jgi:hypothetical protein|nr:hypothetical protein [Desulfobacterales bacterium]MDP6682648.1 hypothetical protein [Desulfobacterales bacterium]MDP6808324.1 hypothetical protein [Desulfobacterales bacterium]MDP7354184.1 hypothetical protein [Desulfobacterales bacterium]HJO63098.1 hypothetical protein [Desulfobacterales bacterium]|tara:strand:- start:690 stop:1136 length:447 start_codon:yes stop_codon:yes gene_type:complete
MCQSYRKVCACGKNTSEIFFGKMILNEMAITQVYCPKCSHNISTESDSRVWDNGWVLELNMDMVRTHAPIMEISPEAVTAELVFDKGYATWVGITPDDHQKRDQERSKIQKLAKTDLRAYIQAMKDWGVTREKRFINEGWRKMKVREA